MDGMMKKIAIINCLKANAYCTGAACLSAFNRKKAFFSIYENEAVELVAFARCNGCHSEVKQDKGLNEKIERLIKIKTDVVHLGVCTTKDGQQCKKITAIVQRLKEHGIKIVCGCHS